MRRRGFLIRAGLLAGGAAGAWWLKDNVLWRGPEVSFADGAATPWLPFVVRATVPTVRVRVGGREVTALIDSGAQYSVIDRALFADLGLTSVFDMPLIAYGVGGNPQVGRGVTLSIDLPGLALKGLRAAILDLGPLAKEAGLGAPLILGQDVLKAVVLDLDTKARRVRLSRPEAHVLTPDLSPVAVRRTGRGLSTEVTVERAVIQAVIDTGASALLALGRDAARTAGLLDGRAQTSGASIVLGGTIRATMVEARTVTFADQLYRRVAVPIFADAPIPGFPGALLGMEAFAGRRAALDIGRGRLAVSRPLDLTVGR